jgi:hypothetical protein
VRTNAPIAGFNLPKNGTFPLTVGCKPRRTARFPRQIVSFWSAPVTLARANASRQIALARAGAPDPAWRARQHGLMSVQTIAGHARHPEIR